MEQGRSPCQQSLNRSDIHTFSGRFDMRRGIAERFGSETIERVNKLGQVPQKARTSSGGTIDFILTKRVRRKL